MTMQIAEFDEYIHALALPMEGEQYVRAVRSGAPARRVQSSTLAC